MNEKTKLVHNAWTDAQDTNDERQAKSTSVDRTKIAFEPARANDQKVKGLHGQGVQMSTRPRDTGSMKR